MKIAFLTSDDPKNKKSRSGILYSMGQALEKNCGEVSYLGPVKPIEVFAGKVLNKIAHTFLRKNYAFNHSVFLAKKYARIFEQKISGVDFDVIFAPLACTEIAFLETKIPILYLSDATFDLLHNYYPKYFSNLLKTSALQGDLIEELAIKKAARLVYTSKWAAASAMDKYHADGSKIQVIPLGANMENVPSKERIAQKKKPAQCKLLFLSGEWERKGGELILETFQELERMGIPSELTICGCAPPKPLSHSSITVIPYLDRNDTQQNARLERLFLESAFLISPTRSDCSPVAICDANAFGLPVITTNTGGVSEEILEGKNGFVLPLSATGSEYAKVIAKIYEDEGYYKQLSLSSREVFEKRLNWNAWVEETEKVILSMR